MMNTEEQEIFIEALDNLKEFSKLNGNVISKQDIMDNFGGVDLEESQLQLIYGYLQNNHIKISDVEIKENAFEKINSSELEKQQEISEETLKQHEEQKKIDAENDRKFVAMYLEDLKMIQQISESEEADLLNQIVLGDKNAKKQLVEGYLPVIVNMIEPFRENGVAVGDLIQEGNLTLMTLIEEANSTDVEAWNTKFKLILAERIKMACERLIEEQKSSTGISQRILNKVNAVNDCAMKLAEEFERKVTIEEVAGRMGISAEEVKEAINFSSNAIEDISSEKKPHEMPEIH